MEIDNKKADGVKIETDNYEFVIATKKKDVDSNVISEFWFKKK